MHRRPNAVGLLPRTAIDRARATSGSCRRYASAKSQVPVDGRWVPVVLKKDVEHAELLDDVVSRLKTIAEVIKNRP